MNKKENNKVLLFGKNGQVGWELQRILPFLGEVVALDVEDIDFSCIEDLREVVRGVNPYIIVNAAAYTSVDDAEKEPDLAMSINGAAPGVLAEEAKRLGAGLVHYSTDYVFDGKSRVPYTEEDAPCPINVYGDTKLEGEENIRACGGAFLILRTSWLYGLRGRNFFLTFLRLAENKEEVRIVDDQLGVPNWSRMVAEATVFMLRSLYMPCEGMVKELSGVYNLTASGQTTWYGFAQKILSLLPASSSIKLQKLIPINSGEFKAPARRPRFSLLDNSKTSRVFGLNFENWDNILEKMVLDRV